ncbi:hypothetical protein [Maribacter ulvicola]|uniref:Uncharacterized protein n=1 Tax=Maribacter ulvicola TaxID=228959 RepID=A0A1N6Y080_9FLAO|nr:hypothetical protein [Maribacter ulvicola]SIR08075.1 hypothetical protein SAMN05421797_10623 [Maribacter ulvicola]
MKTYFPLILLIICNLNLKAQQLQEFGTEIQVIVETGTKVYKYSAGFDSYCKIKDSIPIYATGKKYSRYLIKQGNCKGYIEDKSVQNEEFIKTQVANKIVAYKKEKIIQDSIAKIEYKKNCQYETNEIDDFNGKLRKYTDFYQVGDILSYLSIQLRNFGGNYSIVFDSAEDLGCASSYSHDKSFVQVKLENGDIVKFYHFGETDCGSFRLQGRLTSGEYNRLLKSPIDKIRLQGTSYYNDIEDIVYKEVFMDKLKCLKQ